MYPNRDTRIDSEISPNPRSVQIAWPMDRAKASANLNIGVCVNTIFELKMAID